MVWTPFVPDAFATSGTVSATNMNKMGTQYLLATNTMNQDMVTPYVSSGLVSSKDGTHANQLDVTSGVAYLLQTDLTVARQALIASTVGQFTTSSFSTTYYLDLNPDASWSFATSHSAVANYLTIAQVTTDGSGNISTVTDERTLNTTLLPNMSGLLTVPSLGGTTADSLTTTHGLHVGSSLTLGGAVISLAGQATAGSFGVPAIVAQVIRAPITTTTLHTVLTYTPAVSGMYRISGCFYQGNSANELITLGLSFTDVGAGASSGHFILPGGTTSLDGSATVVGNGTDWTIVPYLYNLSSAGPLTITYRDPAGAPNDLVTIFVERLS